MRNERACEYVRTLGRDGIAVCAGAEILDDDNDGSRSSTEVVVDIGPPFLLGEMMGRDDVFNNDEGVDTGETPNTKCKFVEKLVNEGIIVPNALPSGSVAALPSIRFFLGVPEADLDGNEVGEADVSKPSPDGADPALLISSNIPDKSLGIFRGEGVEDGTALVVFGMPGAGFESGETKFWVGGVGVTDRGREGNVWGILLPCLAFPAAGDLGSISGLSFDNTLV